MVMICCTCMLGKLQDNNIACISSNKVILTMMTKFNECNEGMHDDGEEGVTQNRYGRAEDILQSAFDNSPSGLNLVEQQKVPNQNCKRENAGATLQTFVDNKRKQLEKNLSAVQQDQMFPKLAKDELKMKETMVASLGQSATQTSKAMDKIRNPSLCSGKCVVMVWR